MRLFFVFVLVAVPVVAGPVTRPQSPDVVKQQAEVAAVAEAARLPLMPATRPADIVRCSIVNKMLQMDVVSAASGMFRVDTGTPHVTATVRQTTLRTTAERAIFYLITDFSLPGTMTTQTTVAGGAGPTQVVWEYESDRVSGKAELIQDPPQTSEANADADDPVRLTIQQLSDPPAASDFTRKLSARNFVELRRQYPSEVNQYLGPVFHELGQDPSITLDPAAAWQVLGDGVPLDAAVAAKVKELLPKLGSETFADRRSAMQSLHALGEPAALVLMKMDSKGWSLEQSNAIDTFLSAYEPLDAKQAAALANDPGYLLGVQYDDNSTLRELAAQRLSKVLSRPITFDPKSADAVRIPAVEAFRKTLPATRPATRPADG